MTLRPSWYQQQQGIIEVTGPDRIAFMQRMCSQDVRPLSEPGQEVLALFLNAKGRLIDEVRMASLPSSLQIITAAHRAQTLINWLTPYTIMDDVHYKTVSEAAAVYTVLDAQPGHVGLAAAADSLGFACGPTPAKIQTSAQQQAWLLTPRRALGPGAVIVACDQAAQVVAQDALQAAFGAPVSEREMHERLIRAGLAQAEVDYPTAAPPFELRLGQDSIHWHKGCYIGQEVISRLEAYDKVPRLMMGIAASDGASALQGEAKDIRVMVDGSAAGRLSRYVPDATGLGLVGLCIVKKTAAVAQPATLVDAAGHTVPAALFNCPQWQP